MISASGLELRAGARVLVSEASFRVADGDKVGLVGRNGAGKTTMMRVLAGEGQPAAGTVSATGTVGYLPQDPRTADPAQSVRDRVLSARQLHEVVARMRRAERTMASADEATRDDAMRRYARAEAEFTAAGGYAAEAEAAAVAAGLGIDNHLLEQPLGTLSGGQRRRVELARLLFAADDTLLLDEPTNHLDADSIVWLRQFLMQYPGGVIVISHDVDLLGETVNKVMYLDANRARLDVYNLGWKAYLAEREAVERRRKKTAATLTKKASALEVQAEKMRAKATKAKAAQGMLRRAERLRDAVGEAARAEAVAHLRFPEPAPCGRVPLSATGLSKSYGSQEVFVDVGLAVDRGARVVVLGLNGAGKTTLLRILAGIETPDTGDVAAGHGVKVGYYAQEHETLDPNVSVLVNLLHSSEALGEQEARNVLGSFLFSGDTVEQPAGTLSGGEKTRLALAMLVVSGANVLLLDEPTNNLDPASRDEVLAALGRYRGAVILVTHDHGAVAALDPERVLILPEGDEDLWRSDYLELVELA
ncbi:MAG: ABC-F family ATP-binding cassette domain-containing protein [Actinobacteria bacterium]|nr:ABC-F family ATP-binding cassette domain-containing protein [Actinomycetota bacterium]MCB9412398.1 ABC-F family ATP-binding cassette domain-containing protein [Actinomycetota bacterium]